MDFATPRETLGERNHVRESLRRENLFESGAHGSKREGVTCQRAANSASVAIFEMNAARDFFCDLRAAAVGSCRQAARDGLADDEHVRLERVFASVAAGAGAYCVSFVHDDERAVAACDLAAPDCQ